MSQTSDLDIQTVAYKTDERLYLVLNNADIYEHTTTINMHGLGENNIANIEWRQLYNDQQGTPQLDIQSLVQLPDIISMPPRSSVLLAVELNQAIASDVTLEETHYYSSTMTQGITANQSIDIPFSGIAKSDDGWAVLRLGIARDHANTLAPVVTLNDQILDIPSDYRGYDQYHNGQGRDNFYGVLEVPVPITDVNQETTFNLAFPDDGGTLASATLAVFSANGPISE